MKTRIRKVRTFCTSNVGADEDTRTLWVFGAGASRHLGFPLSSDLFSRSISICTERMRRFKNTKDVGYLMFRSCFSHAPTITELKAFRNEPALALKFRHTWDYLKPANEHYVRIQTLYRLWMELPDDLAGIGMVLSAEQLVESYPEVLINNVRGVDPKKLMKAKRLLSVESARKKIIVVQEKLQEIYFLTLSHFNNLARTETNQNAVPNHYYDLVRSFILEKNARMISFNYDTILDGALFSHFTTSWHYGGMTVAGINGYPVSSGAAADLTYIKPHGSLNYLICPGCQRAYVNWFWSYKQTGANTAASGNRRCAHCKTPTKGRKDLLSNLVVSPLYDKTIIKRSYEAIASAFRWAEIVVAVGYSFPEQDDYVYRCIKKGLEGRRTPLTVTIVSHSPGSARQTKARFSRQLTSHGVRPKQVVIRAKMMHGFEEVRTGYSDIAVR